MTKKYRIVTKAPNKANTLAKRGQVFPRHIYYYAMLKEIGKYFENILLYNKSNRNNNVAWKDLTLIFSDI